MMCSRDATATVLQVRSALLRGLLSFPCEPGMLSMFLDMEKFSGSQLRLVHHLSEVSDCRCVSVLARILLLNREYQRPLRTLGLKRVV